MVTSVQTQTPYAEAQLAHRPNVIHFFLTIQNAASRLIHNENTSEEIRINEIDRRLERICLKM